MTERRENVVPGRFVVPQAVRGWPALEGAWLERLWRESARNEEAWHGETGLGETGLGETGHGETWHCERGIWGKAHGARSDFRWLARSAGFARRHADLGRRLNLGLEDRPRAFAAWRRSAIPATAVAAYPSRATDAAGRAAFPRKAGSRLVPARR